MGEFVITDSFVGKKTSYERFAKLQTDLVNCEDSSVSIVLDVQNRFGCTFVFLFSSLPFLLEKHGKKTEFFCNEKSFNLLKKIGLLPVNETYYSKNDYAPVFMKRANRITRDFDVFRTVTEITRDAPIRMNQKLSAIFISKVGEMFNNALEHSDGTVLGAKYFKYQKNKYCFSCYDTGIGIPNKVMASNKDITDSVDAFNWAMKDGNSTALGSVPRGLGLGLLKNFAKANAGTIRICSGNVLYIYSPNQIERYQRLKYTFQGTLFEMDIVADNDHEYIIR